MNKKLSLLAGTIAMALAAPAAAQMVPLNDPVVAHPDPESLFTSKDKKLHRNKQAALHIVRNLLQCNQWDRAGEWLTPRYIQHNPMAASGLDSVVHFFTNVFKREPVENCGKLTNPVVAVQAEGDFVTVMFVRTLPVPSDPSKSYTTTWFDTWRFVDGKADEHWDPATLPEAAPTAAEANPAQEAADRAEIEQLMWNYVRAIDGFQPEAYAATFTEDGTFLDIKGRAGLSQMVADMKKSQDDRRAKGETIPPMYHVMANQNIEFTGRDTARVHYYWQTMFAGNSAAAQPPRIAAGGRGVDDVVRVNGKWLIKKRDVAPQG